MSVHVQEDHLRRAKEFVDATRARGELAPVDLKQFWEDQRVAMEDPFGKDIPQLAFGGSCNWECVFAELGIPQDWKRYSEAHAWRASLQKAYNDLSEKIVGRRLLPEENGTAPKTFAQPKPLYELFEMENIWNNESQSYWLKESAHTPEELATLLDRVEKRLEDPSGFFLPDCWGAIKEEMAKEGKTITPYRGQRGPITFAMSCYGVENLVFLIMDNPELAGRFRDCIISGMIAKIKLHRHEAGDDPAIASHGFGFWDDNCCMLNAEMYDFFGYPILRDIFAFTSSDPETRRYQHSDSDMEHLLPALGKVDLTGANFGPNVMVDSIRKHLPRAVIEGQLAPFTYSRNEEVNMVAELLRDFELAGDDRGLVFTTAGSINNGSRLSGMRLLMGAIQKFCRY